MKITKLPSDVTTYEQGYAYMLEHPRPGLFILQVCHDDWCPTIKTQRAKDCAPTCHPDVWLVEPFSDARDN